MTRELLSKKEPALYSLGSSWPIPIAKDTKIWKFTVRKSYSGQRTKGVATKTFAKEIGCVTHGSTTQPSQHKPKIEIGLIRKDL